MKSALKWIAMMVGWVILTKLIGAGPAILIALIAWYIEWQSNLKKNPPKVKQ